MNDDTRDIRQTHPAHHPADDGPTPPDPPSTEPRGVPGENGHVPPELIAAWLDTPDDFDASERAAIAAHVAGCPHCQQVVADLRGIVSALASLPQVTAPRSFSLTREMVAEPVVPEGRTQGPPVQMRQTTAWYERQMRAVRWATAVAAVLFVFILSVDLVTNRIDPNREDDSAAISAQSEAAGGAAADEAQGDPGGDDTVGSARQADEAEESESTESADTAAMTAEDATELEESAPDGAATPASGESAVAEAEEEPAGETADTTLAAQAPDADQGDTGAEAEPFPATSPSDGQMVDETSERLRIIQVALALILVWLLAAMIALPRMRRR